MYKLDLKSQPKTIIGQLNMIVPIPDLDLQVRGHYKKINVLTHAEVQWKLIRMLLKRKDEIEY